MTYQVMPETQAFLAPVREFAVLARLRATMAALGPSEAKVAAVLLARADEVVGWSTAELAEAATTSTATVIRACQSLGYRGFQHLRLELARSGSHPAPAGERSPERDRFDDAIDALRYAQSSVAAAALEEAVATLRSARRILLIGNGFSGPPLQDFAMRLSTVGIGSEAPVDPLAQQFSANTLSHQDVALALSYSGANVQSVRACAAACERGAKVIVVTSYQRSPMGRLASTVITTGAAGSSHDVDPNLARLAHTVVLHELHARLSENRGISDVAGMRRLVAEAITDDDPRAV